MTATMTPSRLHQAWAEGRAASTAWLATSDSYLAEIAGHSLADAVLIDLQHGMMDQAHMIPLLQAIATTPATPLVRLSGLDGAQIMRALDCGALGLVCPLVDTPEQAQALVAASSFPPMGGRSFGPGRAMFHGDDYPAKANDVIVRLAMIETRAGLDNVESICATPGLTGIFIGPSDLSLALGKPPAADPTDPEVQEAMAHCLATAKAAGKRVGLYCPDGTVARRRADEGYDLVSLGGDAHHLACAYRREIAAFEPPQR